MQTAEPTANPANSPTCIHNSTAQHKKRLLITIRRRRNQSAACPARSTSYRSRVRGDGEGDEHHVEGHDDLDDERVPVRPRRRGGAEHRDGVQHRLEHERRADGAGELRRPVEGDLPSRQCKHVVSKRGKTESRPKNSFPKRYA